MQSRKGSMGAAALAVLLLLLTACGQTPVSNQQPAAPSASSGGQQAAEAKPAPKAPLKLEVGKISKSASGTAMAIAEEKGFFKDENLAVNISYFSKPTEAFAALQTNAVGLVSGAPDPVITNRAQGGSFAVISGEIAKPDWVLIAAKDITQASQLKGKTVGGSQLVSATTRMAVQAVEKLGGIQEKDFQVIEVGATANRLMALSNGAIQATVLSLSDTHKAIEQGFNVLGYIKDIIQVPGTVLMTDQKWANQNREAVVRYLRAQHRGQEFFYDPKNKDEVIDILARYTGNARKYAEATYNDFFKLEMLSRKGEIEPRQLQGIIDSQVQLGLLKGRVPAVDEIVDLSFNQEAATGK